jgi:dTDP-4-amino-4,6-dideoxygalactose transaminase
MPQVENKHIPFNLPYMTGKEQHFIAEAHAHGKLAGDGPFTKKCHQWLEDYATSNKVLLTHSCTAALEMSALLLDLNPGDEVILPSYTFVSTANAFVLRGAVPVFVDIRPDTLNIDETQIEAAITPKTRAIIPVHYAGVGCEMDTILEIARRHNLVVIEDAAQAVMARYKGRPLGSIGDLGTFSFHETKNVISGEGGSLLINDGRFAERAEIIREKGTDRSRFFRGAVDKYTWQDIGSSYLPGELIAAFLWAQLEEAAQITAKRLALWGHYHQAFAEAEKQGLLRRPIIPAECEHNAHMYYVLLADEDKRNKAIKHLDSHEINAIFHYIPLHSSPAGEKFGRTSGTMHNTNSCSTRILRLPLWIGLSMAEVERIANTLIDSLR